MEEEFKTSKKRLNFNTKLDNIELYSNEIESDDGSTTGRTKLNSSTDSDNEGVISVRSILTREQIIAKHFKNKHKINRLILEKASDFRKLLDFSFDISVDGDGSFTLMVDEDDGDYAESFVENMHPLKIIIVKVKNLNRKGVEKDVARVL